MKYQHQIVPGKYEEVKKRLSRIVKCKDLGNNTLEFETEDLTRATSVRVLLEMDGYLVKAE